MRAPLLTALATATDQPDPLMPRLSKRAAPRCSAPHAAFTTGATAPWHERAAMLRHTPTPCRPSCRDSAPCWSRKHKPGATPCRSARGDRPPALLRRRGRARLRADHAARPDRRSNVLHPARSWRLGLHQPWNFRWRSSWARWRGAGDRQHRGQTGRADAGGALEAVKLLHAAGVPPTLLQTVTGPANGRRDAGSAPDVAGVVFTGSTQVAKIIQRSLAAKDGPIVPLIAETGGINAMLVDSDRLPGACGRRRGAVAFRSAGQRCSALRLLCVHEEIADHVMTMLRGAMKELGGRRYGASLATDVGPPLIDPGRSMAFLRPC